MKTCTRSLSFKSLLSLLLLAFLSVPALAQGISPALEARLQAVLDRIQNDPEQPFIGGMSASIKIEGVGKWAGASGYAARHVDASNELLPGGTPFTTSTLSRAYSTTKTFTGALILQLAAEKKLDLDAPIGTYLPLRYINPQLSEAVTIRQLLAHESGFSDYVHEFNFQLAVAFQPDRIWSPLEIAYFAKKLAEPGAERRYSSTNYILLGAIAELATGKTAAQLLRERYLSPLQLNDTYLAVFETAAHSGRSLDASPHDNLSPFNPIFYMLGRPTFPDAYTNVGQFDFTGIASAAFTGGGLVTSVDDLVEWGSALFSGRATGQRILQQMLQSIADSPDEDGDYIGYGIWRNYKISPTESFVGHNGMAPGYRSIVFHQQNKRVTIAILSNFYGKDPYEIAGELYAVISEQYAGDKIKLCLGSKSLQVDPHAAAALVAQGASLGACSSTVGAAAGRREPGGAAPQGFSSYPNPASKQVNFSVTAAGSGPVSLQIFTLSGALVARVYSGAMEAGEEKNLVWTPATNLPDGMYLGQLSTAAGVQTQRVLLSR
jgi:CubicO group peptidase (beta-lactamase class C family)